MSAVVLLVTATGCLKDKDYDNGLIQSERSTGAVNKAIEIKLTANANTNVLSLAFSNSGNDTMINLIPVNLATSDPAAQDLHVTLVQNDKIVSDYNAANTDTTVTASNPNPSGVVTHDVVPTKFTLINPGGVVVIPKGSHTGYLQIRFKPSDFLGTTYALGYTISAVAEAGYAVSGNLSNGMVAINIKNQYDGNYHASGVRVHPTLGNLPFTYDVDMNTVSVNALLGNALADLKADLTVTVNPDNTVNVSSVTDPVVLTPGAVNSYDPATRTFTLHYFYAGAGGNRVISETLVKN
jgi:hypothetical protein